MEHFIYSCLITLKKNNLEKIYSICLSTFPTYLVVYLFSMLFFINKYVI
jgi:hypothetical protein